MDEVLNWQQLSDFHEVIVRILGRKCVDVYNGVSFFGQGYRRDDIKYKFLYSLPLLPGSEYHKPINILFITNFFMSSSLLRGSHNKVFSGLF